LPLAHQRQLHSTNPLERLNKEIMNRAGAFGGLFPERMEPMGRASKYSPEVRERAVRMVFDHAPEHSSQWAAIRSVGKQLGIRTESLRRGVRQAERDAGQHPSLTTSERSEELQRVQRENFDLKRANEILRKASAFFAQAELDRRAK
jgi:transposase-like protein